MRTVIYGKILLGMMILWVATDTIAQMHHPGMSKGAYVYDKSTEVTLQGTIESITQQTGRGGWAGTHLMLKTSKGSIDVHVGPSWYLSKKNISFKPGETIEVTGSQVKFAGEDAILAREIKKGDQTLQLRNTDGYPLWSRRGMR